MAHTDRDYDRWFWRDHYRSRCVNSWRKRAWGAPYAHCGICARHSRDIETFWYARGKRHWNRAQRKAERTKAAQALREAQDYDELVIDYRRPYWD